MENYVSFTVRDEFSGCGLANPRKTRSKSSNYKDLKCFVGSTGSTLPNIIVKSDAAGEIISAVEELGWFSEPSLQNRFPHNAVHERWVGTLKSTIRSAMLQSGFPERAAEWPVPYASMSLVMSQPCPIHSHERDEAGNIRDAFKHRENWTCWQAFHGGEDFAGKRPNFGQLCYYLDSRQHTLMPKTSPGLFVGWCLESGLRYRGVMFIADYETVRHGNFDWKRIVTVHEREVYVPEELTFPFAEAQKAALTTVSPPPSVLPSLAEVPLPFDAEAGEGDPPAVRRRRAAWLRPGMPRRVSPLRDRCAKRSWSWRMPTSGRWSRATSS